MKKLILLIALTIILCFGLTACGMFNNHISNNKPDGFEMGDMDSNVNYESQIEYTEDTYVKDEIYSSEGKDENNIHILNGASVSLDNISITRKSANSTGGDNSSFFGVGAALLVTDGDAYINNSTINTDAKGGAGIFSYDNSAIYVSDTIINTSKDTSGGIHVAGGGKIFAWNLNIETQGESSAAIRSDRGGGEIVADGGSYISNGTGSPAIYSTADIVAHSADLKANSSEAICIEGLNSVFLFDCNLSGNMSDNSQNDTTWNVILYQSMSGDSEEGNSTFEMIGGKLKASNGGMFYTTNTESTFILSDVSIEYSDSNDFFLQCTGNANKRGWGNSGQNGAQCNFTALNQDMIGNIIWDSISKLDFYITDGSVLTGAIVDNESWSGENGNGYCNVYLDSNSKWIITGDSTVTNLYCTGTITDSDGNDVAVIDTDGNTLVEGSSIFSVTVSDYEKNVDTTGSSNIKNWEDFKVNKPSQLS